jgi:hypothetical protein
MMLIRCCSLLRFSHPMQPAGVVQDALGCRGLTGIDVRHDADIPYPI